MLAFVTRKNDIAPSLSGIYEISRKLYTTILFIKIDFTPAGHHQLNLKTISVYFKTKIIIKFKQTITSIKLKRT